MGPGTKTALIVASGFAWTFGASALALAIFGEASDRAKLTSALVAGVGSIATTYMIVKS